MALLTRTKIIITFECPKRRQKNKIIKTTQTSKLHRPREGRKRWREGERRKRANQTYPLEVPDYFCIFYMSLGARPSLSKLNTTYRILFCCCCCFICYVFFFFKKNRLKYLWVRDVKILVSQCSHYAHTSCRLGSGSRRPLPRWRIHRSTCNDSRCVSSLFGPDIAVTRDGSLPTQEDRMSE